VQDCLRHGVPMIDCQMPSPHLASLGARLLPRATFEAELARLATMPPPPWGRCGP
jgi:leucyl/phenylalanyl-tRNA--protein transferase